MKLNNSLPLFSMCSLYPEHKRMMCACFLGKSKDVVQDMKSLYADYLMWGGLGSGVVSLCNLEQEIYSKRIWDKEGNCDKNFIDECHRQGIKIFGVVFTGQGGEIGITTDEKEEKLIEFGKSKNNILQKQIKEGRLILYPLPELLPLLIELNSKEILQKFQDVIGMDFKKDKLYFFKIPLHLLKIFYYRNFSLKISVK